MEKVVCDYWRLENVRRHGVCGKEYYAEFVERMSKYAPAENKKPTSVYVCSLGEKVNLGKCGGGCKNGCKNGKKR